jgi:hypothetical protein
MWHIEDTINPLMHLASEWSVPAWLSRFSTPSGRKARQLKVVVQVWKREDRPRGLWSDMSFRPDPSVPAFQLDPKGTANVAVTITGNECKVGKSGVVGRDVILTQDPREARLTPRGKERLRPVVAPGCTTREESNTLGTVKFASTGTAALLRTPDPDGLVDALNGAVKSGRFKEAFSNRGAAHRFVSLSFKALERLMSGDWKMLIRPLKVLPGISKPPR